MRLFLLFLFLSSHIGAMEKEVSFAESPKEKRRRVTARLITSFVGKESDTLTKHVGRVFMKKVKLTDAGDPEFWEAVNHVIEETKKQNEDKEEEDVTDKKSTSLDIGAAVKEEKEDRLSKKLEHIKDLLVSSLEEAVEKQHCTQTEKKYELLKAHNNKIKLKIQVATAALGLTSLMSGIVLIFIVLAQ